MKHASSIGHVEDDSCFLTHLNLEMEERQKNFPYDSEEPAWDKVMATLSQCHVMDKNCKIFQWLSLSAG